MENNMELELRAEISLDRFDSFLFGLKKKQKLLSKTKRLSVMFLGVVNQIDIDIRVRASSNGKNELVIKKGGYHSHDRIEFSQEIKRNEFIGIVKILSLFGFRAKVTERENFSFDLGNNITIILVRAKSIAYIEIEKMSHEKNRDENRDELLRIINDFNLKLIDSENEFNELCNRLTKDCDWVFDGTASHIERLETMLMDY